MMTNQSDQNTDFLVDDLYTALKLLATKIEDDASDRRISVRSGVPYIEVAFPQGTTATVHSYRLTPLLVRDLLSKHYIEKRALREYQLSLRGYQALKDRSD